MSVEVEGLKEELVAAIRREEALTAAVRDLAAAATVEVLAVGQGQAVVDIDVLIRLEEVLAAHASTIQACRENQ